MKMDKKQIPNILSVVRLLLVPVFVAVFFSGISNARLWALLVFAIAEFTDVLDGYLARRNDWITDIGKILDPLADKLLQAAAIICLAITDHTFIWLAALFFAKECCMFAGAFIVLKKHKEIAVSSWYGKMASTVFAGVVMALIIWHNNATVTLLFIALLAAVLIFALLMYYFRIFRGKYGIKK